MAKPSLQPTQPVALRPQGQETPVATTDLPELTPTEGAKVSKSWNKGMTWAIGIVAVLLTISGMIYGVGGFSWGIPVVTSQPPATQTATTAPAPAFGTQQASIPTNGKTPRAEWPNLVLPKDGKSDSVAGIAGMHPWFGALGITVHNVYGQTECLTVGVKGAKNACPGGADTVYLTDDTHVAKVVPYVYVFDGQPDPS